MKIVYKQIEKTEENQPKTVVVTIAFHLSS
jgi:hypothetical protein